MRIYVDAVTCPVVRIVEKFAKKFEESFEKMVRKAIGG